jgi:hypothetical protein
MLHTWQWPDYTYTQIFVTVGLITVGVSIKNLYFCCANVVLGVYELIIYLVVCIQSLRNLLRPAPSISRTFISN